MKRFIILILLLFCFCVDSSAWNPMVVTRGNQTGDLPCTTSQQAENGAQDATLSIGRYSDEIYRCFKFTYSGTNGKQICAATTWMNYTGSGTDNYTFSIYANNATPNPDEPDEGNILGTADQKNLGGIGSSEAEVSWIFSTPTSVLSNGTLYWACIKDETGNDSSNYASWYLDNGGTTEIIATDADAASWTVNEAYGYTGKWELFSE